MILPSVSEFLRRYEGPNQPVIIRGAMDDWEIYRNLPAWLEKRKDSSFKVNERLVIDSADSSKSFLFFRLEMFI